MQNITISHGATIYVFAHTQVPIFDELPWHNEECDAFVVVLAEDVLVDDLLLIIVGVKGSRNNGEYD